MIKNLGLRSRKSKTDLPLASLAFYLLGHRGVIIVKQIEISHDTYIHIIRKR